ncbi:MAG: hypothetical protein ACR2O4_04845 [Hyphomicrobiaceae bacterium]
MATNATLTHETSVVAVLKDATLAVTDFFGDIARAGHAASRYQHLSTLSEQELETLGCTREEAARKAFEESFGKL